VSTLSHENPALPGVTNPTETNTRKSALSELKVAATVAEPVEMAVSNPELETPATDAGVVLQVAVAVTSLVVLSLYVTIALS
jgi:hypothetical protein